jgi:dimethylhistidine N-methyltransferase
VTDFAAALLAGLSARPRAISPQWFYDAAGSQLFEQICQQPAYYPTRVELVLLERHAVELARHIGPGAEVVEFGAGASRKVRLLIAALDTPAGYVPVDISGDHLLAALASLRVEHPGLDIRPVIGDFTQALDLPPARGRRVGFFPGGSIGNFEPSRAQRLLQRMAAQLTGGWLIVGVDLVKDPQALHAAYNDPAGVTAAFNLNLWARANREAGADFDLGQWWHSALYNPRHHRIEMHLVSRRAQRVSIAGRAFEFAEGDSVHTEDSYKYSLAGFQDLARLSGWEPRQAWTDDEQRFSVHLLRSFRSPGDTGEVNQGLENPLSWRSSTGPRPG